MPEHFYPRSPCGERLKPPVKSHAKERIFLSTLSLRRATRNGLAILWNTCISIHALLAESDRIHRQFPYQSRISIHALLAESDPVKTVKIGENLIFLSTLSLRRATRNSPGLLGNTQFLSTLSLRRATPGERHASTQQEFLSTLSLRRATQCHLIPNSGTLISIHALLAESDLTHDRRKIV